MTLVSRLFRKRVSNFYEKSLPFPELMAIYNASINSFVHVVMYTYYFLSSFKSIKGFIIAIKPVITIVQLVQFVLILGHCIIAILPDCNSGIFFHLQIANLCMLIILFGHFFITNYLKKKPQETN